MKWSTIKRVFAIYMVNHIFAGTYAFEIKRKILNSVGFKIGTGTKIVGPIYCTGRLTVGKGCWIGKNFEVHGNGNVIIGDCCDLAPDIAFLTGGHQIGTSNRRAGDGESYTIKIGDGTWVGARSTVLGNTEVGKGVVIAAGACVICNLESNIAVGGVPAKRIKKLDDECETNHKK